MQEQFAEAMFDGASSLIDVSAIKQSWQKLNNQFLLDDWVLPLPAWAKRPFTEDGSRAWAILQSHLSYSAANGPMSIYLHVPFCNSKCGFCDSYSFKLGNHREEHVVSYVGLLKQEMRTWSRQGNLAHRPVSTVHLGGGTPAFLGPTRLADLVEACAHLFNVSGETEWALESTVTHLTPQMLRLLHSLGFRRLHIGVQSLEDTVRSCIGRRGPAEAAVAKIQEALSLGWVVSVDLICGLPGQTLTGFLDAITRLAEVGTDGFSLYELLIYPQNYRWARRLELTKRSHLTNFLMFHAGSQLLESRGFRKNLFNHWADERDENRYFTFPTRGEDLLALGTIADGVFGDYHYRHPRYPRYCHGSKEGFPGLEGGLRRNDKENALLPFITAILSGRISAAIAGEFALMSGTTDANLLEEWLEHDLMKADPSSGGYLLTPNGSWFSGNMISHLEKSYDNPATRSTESATMTPVEYTRAWREKRAKKKAV